MINFKFKAFTLAEVLITMAVLGVIASLTIPSIVKNMDKNHRIAFKKIYSDLQQATLMIKAENNGTMVGAFALDNDDFRNKYLTYLKYTKKCISSARSSATATACTNGYTRKYLNGVTFTDNSTLSYADLNNGAILEFALSSVDCTEDHGFNGDFAPGIICGTIFVDVNGFKGPNTLGKDVYSVWVVKAKNGLLPNGWPGDSYSHCTADSWGDGCAYKALYDIDY